MTFLERLGTHQTFIISVSIIIAALVVASTFESLHRPAVFMMASMPAVIASVLVPSRMGPGLFLLMPFVVQVSTAVVVWCFTGQDWPGALGIGALLVVAYIVMFSQNQDDKFADKPKGHIQ